MAEVTRFAPSPSGELHLGHAYAALFAAAAAGDDGRFLLRFEDLDRGRCKPIYETAIEADLAWLGLAWTRPAWRQTEHMEGYRAALRRLIDDALVYPCFCTRREIQAEIAASGLAPQEPEGPLYPGTCRRLARADRQARLAAGEAHAWRLDLAAADRRAGALRWYDIGRGWQAATPGLLGDAVLAGKESAVAYHLAVVVDDAAQGVTLVTRGEDLVVATHLHRLLQALLDLPEPRWHHHALIRDEQGRRLAKRDRARSLAQLRATGSSAAAIRSQLGFPAAGA